MDIDEKRLPRCTMCFEKVDVVFSYSVVHPISLERLFEHRLCGACMSCFNRE